MKPIKKEFEFLLDNEGSGSSHSFRVYKKKDEIGRLLFNDLLEKMVFNEKLGFYVFYLDDINKNVGLVPQLYGVVGLLNMITRFNIQINEEERKKIDSALTYILDYIEGGNKNQYDFSPYIDEEVNKKIFLSTKHKFILSETWALSLFVMIRRAYTSKMMDFDPATMKRINANIKYLIKSFVENVVGTPENPEGWAYSTQRNLPASLYFTHAVLETYSDVDDCIMGTSEGVMRDDELIDFIGKNEDDELYVEKFKDLCEKIGDRTWNLYKNDLKDNFVDDKYYDGFQKIKKEELFNIKRSNSLFNTVFIINILFYSYENTRNTDESDEVVALYKNAFQYLFNAYEELRKINRETGIEKYILYFEGNDENTKQLNETIIPMETLMPLMVNALNKIALYIYKYPQQDMTNLFDYILENRSKDKWLWEKRRYDLLVTQRYEGAFIAYFEYYDEYERDYVGAAKSKEAIEEDLRADLRIEIEKEYKKRFEKELKEAVANETKEIGNSFVIENEINKRIDTKIKDKSLEIINDMIEKMTIYNKLQSQQKKTFEWTEEEKRFYNNFNEYIKSYLYNDFKEATNNDNEKMSEVEENTYKDIKEFVKKYIELNNSNLSRNSKIKLSSILELLESYITAINKYNNSHKNSPIDPISGFEKIINN